jgi:hypothetical protein
MELVINVEEDMQERMYELKRIISTLEWDIQYMGNTPLKEYKQSRLIQYKEELKELLTKSLIIQ